MVSPRHGVRILHHAFRFQGSPSANLIGQILRQITQPLSKAIVNRVKKRPLLRKYVLIQLGRFYYWCESMIKWREIPVMAEKRAVNDDDTMELGTKLLLELLVFGLLCSVLVYETQKTAKLSRVTEQLRVQELNDLEMKKDRLMRRVEDQVILTKRLKDIIVEYSRNVGYTLPSDPEEEKASKSTTRQGTSLEADGTENARITLIRQAENRLSDFVFTSWNIG